MFFLHVPAVNVNSVCKHSLFKGLFQNLKVARVAFLLAPPSFIPDTSTLGFEPLCWDSVAHSSSYYLQETMNADHGFTNRWLGLQEERADHHDYSGRPGHADSATAGGPGAVHSPASPARPALA